MSRNKNTATAIAKYATVQKDYSLKQFLENIVKNLPGEDPVFTCQYFPNGVPVRAAYRAGVLVELLMRVNGDKTVNIYRHHMNIAGLPDIVPTTHDTLIVDGVVTMGLKEYTKYIKTDLQPTPARPTVTVERAVDNALSHHDYAHTAGLKMSFWPNEVVEKSYVTKGLDPRYDHLATLVELGFDNAGKAQFFGSITMLMDRHKALSRTINDFKVPMQGVMVALSSTYLRSLMGVGENGLVNWGVVSTTTRRRTHHMVNDINFVTRWDGYVVPELVLQHGRTVNTYTFPDLETWELHQIGVDSKITLLSNSDGEQWIDSNETLAGQPAPDFPIHCPSCNNLLYPTPAGFYCGAGIDCRAQLIATVTRMCSADGLNIMAIDEDVAGGLVHTGLVSSPADVFKLHKAPDKIRNSIFRGWTDEAAYKGMKRFEASITAGKSTSFARFLYAAAIPHVTQQVANALALEFSNLGELVEAVSMEDGAGWERLAMVQATVEDPEKFGSIVEWLEDEKNYAKLYALTDAGVTWKEVKLNNSNCYPLAGVAINCHSRSLGEETDEAKSAVLALGGKTVIGLSPKTTDIVVVSDDYEDLDRFKGVDVWTFSELMRIVDDHKVKS